MQQPEIATDSLNVSVLAGIVKKPIFREQGVKLIIATTIFIPSLMQMKLQLSSLATGLLIMAFFILLAALVAVRHIPLINLLKSVKLAPLITIGLILVHYLLSRIFVLLPQDSLRFLLGFSGLVLLVAAARVVASSLVQLNQNAVQRIISFIMGIFVLNAILTLTGIDFLGTATNKSTFLFGEPSHFAFLVTPFLIYYVKTRSFGWAFALLIFILTAIYIENLTMMVMVLLTAVVSFRMRVIFLIFPIFLLILFFFADTDYFSNRLSLSPNDSDNLSVLVYFQGWQNALLAFWKTSGWGVGFQQFGIASPTGEVTEKILLLYGLESNLLDGGSLAPKLLGEFGILGAVIIMAMTVRAARAFCVLKHGQITTNLFLFARCVEVGILIELFIRGVGYFSPGLFIYLIILFCNNFLKKQLAVNAYSGRRLN